MRERSAAFFGEILHLNLHLAGSEEALDERPVSNKKVAKNS